MGLPLQVPFEQVSVEPLVVEPLTVGSEAFEGGDMPTVTGADVAEPEPPMFDAVTVQRRSVPAGCAITYVELVAPPIVTPSAVHA